MKEGGKCICVQNKIVKCMWPKITVGSDQAQVQKYRNHTKAIFGHLYRFDFNNSDGAVAVRVHADKAVSFWFMRVVDFIQSNN